MHDEIGRGENCLNSNSSRFEMIKIIKSVVVEIPLLAHHHHRAAPFTPLATLAAQERVTHSLKMLPDIQTTDDE